MSQVFITMHEKILFSACLTILNYFSHMKWPSKSSSKVICFSLNSFVTFCIFELGFQGIFALSDQDFGNCTSA